MSETSPRELAAASGRSVLSTFLAVVRGIGSHGSSNQAVTSLLEKLSEAIALGRRQQGGQLRLQLIDRISVLNETRLRSDEIPTEHLETFVALFEERGLGGLCFARPIDPESLRLWFVRFLQPAATPEAQQQLGESIKNLGPHLGIEALEPRTLDASELFADRAGTLGFAVETYARVMIGFAERARALAEDRRPSERLNLLRTAQSLIDIALERPDHLLQVMALRHSQGLQLERSYAEAHAANTAILSILIGKTLGLDRGALVELAMSGLLADLGFAALPEEETEGNQAMTPAQRARLRVQLLKATQELVAVRGRPSDGALRQAVVAHEHHRARADQETRHPYSQIVAVADAYDAMISERAWRRRTFSSPEALEMMLNEPARFTPLVVEALTVLLNAFRHAA